MNDSSIHQHIEALVKEEERLYDAADERTLQAEERQRLEEINVQLDRYYDLLRQRRARREFGEDPGAAHIRSAGTVEGYLQ